MLHLLKDEIIENSDSNFKYKNLRPSPSNTKRVKFLNFISGVSEKLLMLCDVNYAELRIKVIEI